MNIESDVKYVIVFQSFYITTIEKFMLVHSWTLVSSGHIGFWHFWQVCPYEEFQKMVLISLKVLKKDI